jgi:hypothetical protein
MQCNVNGFQSGIANGRSQKSGDWRTDGQRVRLLTGSKPRTWESMTALLTPANLAMLDHFR